MIPASHISFNDDDTAWVVVEPDPKRGGISGRWFARRCDTCDGTTTVEANGGLTFSDGRSPCPDCGGTGRHTFTIEVGTYAPNGTPDDPTIIIHNERLLVYVVPDMVLPITSEVTDNASVQIAPDGTAFLLDAYTPGQPWTGGSRITLPPAAKPGMWAVKLQVHR